MTTKNESASPMSNQIAPRDEDPWAWNHFDDGDELSDTSGRDKERDEQHPSRYHWCDVCKGFTGPGSPCYSGPEFPEDEHV